MLKRVISSFFLYMCIVVAFAQTAYYDAVKLNDNGRYLEAARAFATLQSAAKADGDVMLYMDCLLSEGEACYMLDWSEEMARIIAEAKRVICDNAATVGDSVRYSWKEAVTKLEGSYNYCMSDVDATAYARAQECYKECFAIIDTLQQVSMSDDAHMRVTVERELLNLYYKHREYEKALEMACLVCDYYNDNGTEKEIADAHATRAMVFARLNMFDAALEDIEVCGNDVEIMRRMGKILMMQQDYDGTDNLKEAKRCYEKYLNRKKRELDKNIASMSETEREQYWLSVYDFMSDCYRLGNYAPDMLYNLSLFCKGYLLEYARNNNTAHYKWQNVRNALKAGECAVEFIQYKGKDDEDFIAALVLDKRCSKPRFVDIGSVAAITSYELAGGYTVKEAIATDNAAMKDALYCDSAFFAKLWTGDLIDATDGCNVLFFAADGFLHQVAMEYMMPCSAVDCHRLSSTRLLVNRKRGKTGRLLLCGGVDYNADTAPISTYNDILGYTSLKKGPVYINNLPGTANEVDSIYSLRKGTSHSPDTLLKGADVTDENFCRLAADNYPMVHISTHGYFVGRQNVTDLRSATADRSLSQSGLIMAGAGRNLNDNSFNPAKPDGLLTAKEIAGMDFSKVGLMVLSACQTGQGYITADGVYGIQRALKLSGVDAIIVSLWSVDDEAATDFMIRFYNELEKEDANAPDIHKAFNRARRDMMSNGKMDVKRFDAASLTTKTKTKRVNKPRYTNAFILIDAL